MSRDKKNGSLGKDGYYEVGYCKPPKHTQFKKGQSGNRSGRPQGSTNAVNDENLMMLIQKAAFRKVVVNDGQRKITMSAVNAMINNGFQKALKGDYRFFKVFIDRVDLFEAYQVQQAELESKKSLQNFIDRFESAGDIQVIRTYLGKIANGEISGSSLEAILPSQHRGRKKQSARDQPE